MIMLTAVTWLIGFLQGFGVGIFWVHVAGRKIGGQKVWPLPYYPRAGKRWQWILSRLKWRFGIESFYVPIDTKSALWLTYSWFLINRDACRFGHWQSVTDYESWAFLLRIDYQDNPTRMLCWRFALEEMKVLCRKQPRAPGIRIQVVHLSQYGLEFHDKPAVSPRGVLTFHKPAD